MNEALEQVRAIVGESIIHELSERTVREALWELYFDVDQTVDWALGKCFPHYPLFCLSNVSIGEHERKRVAAERKGEPFRVFGSPFFPHSFSTPEPSHGNLDEKVHFPPLRLLG